MGTKESNVYSSSEKQDCVGSNLFPGMYAGGNLSPGMYARGNFQIMHGQG
jgi:hypothetical protein